MTITTTENTTTFPGTGAQTLFEFGFVGGDPSYISVWYVDVNGNLTLVPSTDYTLVLNPALPGAIWGVGGSITYLLTGSPIAVGTTLTIQRIVPLKQTVTLSNQGSQTPQSTEMGLDLLEMQAQQVAQEFGQAFAAPLSDPPPASVPTVAQRKNQTAIWDANGNLGAGAPLGTGVVSTAMQPVIDATTLAAGRTAFGLGTMAQENVGAIGTGIEDDGSSNARVFFEVVDVSTSQPIGKTSHLVQYVVSGASPVFTLAATSTLFNGFGFWVYPTVAMTLTPNAADAFLGKSSGASLALVAGVNAFVSTDGAGTWLIYYGAAPPAVLVPQMPFVSFLGIVNDSVTPNTKITVTAKSALLVNSSGYGLLDTTGTPQSIDLLTNGANGMDVGSRPTNGWVYIYLISNGILAGLASLSPTAPTLPTGYTYFVRVGAMWCNGSQNLFISRQVGNTAQWVVAGASLPVIATGTTSSAWVAHAVINTAYAPGTVIRIRGSLVVASAVTALAAPNGNYGTIGSNIPPVGAAAVTAESVVIPFDFVLESNSVYFWANGNASLLSTGWVDSVNAS